MQEPLIESGASIATASAVEALVEVVYEAALDSSVWQKVAERLSSAFGGAGITINIHPMAAPVPSEHYFAGLAADCEAGFRRIFDSGLPWSRWLAPGADERFVRLDAVVALDEFEQSSFFRDVMQPMGLPPVPPVAHLFASHDREPIAGVAIFPTRTHGFGDSDIDLVNRLVPHLRRAFEVLSRLRRVERRKDVLAEVMDRLPNGIILVDSQCRVVTCNLAAEAALGHMAGFAIRDGRPCATDPAANERLQALLTRAIQGRAGASFDPSNVMTLSLDEATGEVPVLVHSLLAPPVDSRIPDAAAVVFLGAGRVTRIASLNVLRTLYGLTAAEAELTRLLADGFSLDEAALARGVTVNTARSQLKQVFAKTGARRQSDVVRLVLDGVAMLRVG